MKLLMTVIMLAGFTFLSGCATQCCTRTYSYCNSCYQASSPSCGKTNCNCVDIYCSRNQDCLSSTTCCKAFGNIGAAY